MSADISRFRKEFSVMIVDADADGVSSLLETVRAIGYENFSFFPTLESAIDEARVNPPHIVLFDYEGFGASSDSALTEFRSISSEVCVLLMVSTPQVLQALQLISRRLAFDSLVRPIVSTLELQQKLDRAATQLYYQFESEQLREHLEQTTSGSRATSSADSFSEDNVFVNEFLARSIMVKELDQTVQIFIDAISRQLENTPVLYFRYMPSHMSMLVAQTAHLPIDKFRGIGLDLKNEDPSRLSNDFNQPAQIQSLRKLVSEVFRRDRFVAFSHFNEGEVLGLFVILGEADIESSGGKCLALRRIFELAYKRNFALKEKHALDVTDSLTGLSNRKHFSKRLDEEISRSRRIIMPLSLVTIDIDRFHILNDKIGFQQADSILRTIGMILRKTTRANDLVARTGPDEFSCLLAHTAHIGAVQKAQRIRRIIESTKFPLLEGKGLGPVTVSSGVSEYPSFCHDAEGLVRSADEAMLQVRRAGGNSVCLATPPRGFQADFIPREVPTGPPLPERGGGR